MASRVVFWRLCHNFQSSNIITSLKVAANIRNCIVTNESRDSSVGIALDYGPGDRGSRVRFPAGLEFFS
jgi:hypothetical protein